MIRYLRLGEVLDLHDRIISETGGSHGLRDLGMLESALGQPKQTFGGRDLYPGLIEKAVALGFSLINNHAFVDGNKRIGHAGVEAILMLAGKELDADIDDAEAEILAVAAGERTRQEFEGWVRDHAVEGGLGTLARGDGTDPRLRERG